MYFLFKYAYFISMYLPLYELYTFNFIIKILMSIFLGSLDADQKDALVEIIEKLLQDKTTVSKGVAWWNIQWFILHPWMEPGKCNKISVPFIQ